MTRPDFRITCCLCGKLVPRASDAYDLDREWQRRFPDMTGTLACPCALNNSWQCRDGRDRYVEGHIPACDSDGMLTPPGRDFDSWCHVGPPGTHVARVLINPWSGLLQGAEEYLRHTAQRSGLDPEMVCRLQRVLDVWDAHHR